MKQNKSLYLFRTYVGKLVISFVIVHKQQRSRIGVNPVSCVLRRIGHRVGDCPQASEQQKKSQACYKCNIPGHKGIGSIKGILRN